MHVLCGFDTNNHDALCICTDLFIFLMIYYVPQKCCKQLYHVIFCRCRWRTKCQEPLDSGRHRRLQRRQLEAHCPGDAEVRETQLEEHRKRRCAGRSCHGPQLWGEWMGMGQLNGIDPAKMGSNI